MVPHRVGCCGAPLLHLAVKKTPLAVFWGLPAGFAIFCHGFHQSDRGGIEWTDPKESYGECNETKLDTTDWRGPSAPGPDCFASGGPGGHIPGVGCQRLARGHRLCPSKSLRKRGRVYSGRVWTRGRHTFPRKRCQRPPSGHENRVLFLGDSDEYRPGTSAGSLFCRTDPGSPV